jgi:hypothetical protein
LIDAPEEFFESGCRPDFRDFLGHIQPIS